MKTDMEKKVEQHMRDITNIFPGKLLLDKKELSQLRGDSLSTINREIENGEGIPYKKQKGKVKYPIREVAIWLSQIAKTA